VTEIRALTLTSQMVFWARIWSLNRPRGRKSGREGAKSPSEIPSRLIISSNWSKQSRKNSRAWFSWIKGKLLLWWGLSQRRGLGHLDHINWVLASPRMSRMSTSLQMSTRQFICSLPTSDSEWIAWLTYSLEINLDLVDWSHLKNQSGGIQCRPTSIFQVQLFSHLRDLMEPSQTRQPTSWSLLNKWWFADSMLGWPREQLLRSKLSPLLPSSQRDKKRGKLRCWISSESTTGSLTSGEITTFWPQFLPLLA